MNEFTLSAPKTKELVSWISKMKKAIAQDSKKFLVVLSEKNINLERAIRNIPSAKAIFANSLNVVDLLDSDSVVMPKASLEVIEKTYLK